jgi:spore coat polysaccharide biosynthesis protein SpsF
MTSNILTVVQARMGSSRLPGKVLFPILGRPLLERMLERVSMARQTGLVVVATTTAPEDNAIEELCAQIKVPCFRGHPTDLLDRHYQAAKFYSAGLVVKIPSDVPLIDPVIIDRVIGEFLNSSTSYHYGGNLHPGTYPDGNDVEIMTSDALEIAWNRADREFEREHTTPFIWERPEEFRCLNVAWESGLDYSMSHRFTIDYPED